MMVSGKTETDSKEAYRQELERSPSVSFTDLCKAARIVRVSKLHRSAQVVDTFYSSLTALLLFRRQLVLFLVVVVVAVLAY